MADFKVDAGIPIPTDFRSTELKYPFETMGVGDSFFIQPEYEDETVKRLANRLAQARQTYQKRRARQGEEVKFTQRIRTENGVSGYRVWRVL
jgi:hypothetical protein|tara:strand:- start:2463 stop:2738 length:276 start_codon:yes stop_codon:yes gene_type:complete